MHGWFVQIAGWLLIAAVLLDIFLTVLYARSGVAIISPWLIELCWNVFRWVSRQTVRCRDAVLSVAGPGAVVVVAGTWVVMFVVGFALVYWPMLGNKLHESEGKPTDTSFMTAVYYAGTTMTTVGSGSAVVEAGVSQFIVTLQSVLGISILTLVVTFLVQIYNALLERNALALKLHFASANTGDAARLLAGIGSGGDFSEARGGLMEIVGEMTKLYESHHFYSVLHVFRFTEPHYAAARVIQLVMETATLVRSALDEEAYAALRGSAAVTALWASGMHMQRDLAKIFLPGGDPESSDLDAETRARWERRYRDATTTLRAAGIKTHPDPVAGAAAYVDQRKLWDRYMTAFAHYMANTAVVVDPAAAGA